MASSSRRKSGSSASNKRRGAQGRSSSAPITRDSASLRSSSGRVPSQKNNPRRAASRPLRSEDLPKIHSQTIGSLQREQKMRQREAALGEAKRKARRPLIIIAAIFGVILVALITLFALSKTDLFAIEDLKIEGADHLTSQEVGALVSIPQGTTLLNVDADSIARSLKRDAWVQDVHIKRLFPHTLEVDVQERTVGAVVEIPMGQNQTIQNWAISKDGVWLMAIPAKESELGGQISQRIYEDADSALHITDVPFGLEPEIGKECTDGNVNNALDIISGMTTELADKVKKVSATDAESTLLTLDNNIEIAFGSATNIRDKERVCLEIMEENPMVVYINVRVVDRPTWRAA